MMMTPDQEIELLKRFEPELRFTKGETFFPMDVEPYVRSSSLWMQRKGMEAVCLIPQGEVSLDNLAQPRMDGNETIYFLRFIEPLDVVNLITFLSQRRLNIDPQNIFRLNTGRLARVGYSSRFADLIFSLSLLLRGRVPGDTSAAAALEYEKIIKAAESFQYHGRVLQQGDWIVLQYWFFYAFNNWRSGYFGVNDHEADWELVNIYLYQDESNQLIPEWVAYSMHDYTGDDLRRRWDDPEVIKVGEHVVVYVGAGSHACYYAPGEYLAELELPFMAPVARFTRRFRDLWRKITGLIGEESLHETSPTSIFRVPFVDFARGDGASIGPGGDKHWGTPRLLSPTPGWVAQYRGLWGLYAQDPVAGEDAPAGPMYNRDGSIRQSWYDPVGFVGLDKQPPPNKLLEYTQAQLHTLIDEQKVLEQSIQEKSQKLSELGVLRNAIQQRSQYCSLDQNTQLLTHNLSEELADLRQRSAMNEKRLDALRQYRTRLKNGEREPARLHIARPHQPASSGELRSSRLAEFWAAISIGLLMITFVVLVLFFRQHIVLGLVALISAFAFIESGFKRQLPQVFNSVAIGLAVVSALLIIFHFFWPLVIVVVVIAGFYVIWENLRELVHL
jgi:hypothetical protein